MEILLMMAGVDEAGRGPVIGPMIIASVGFDECDIEEISKLGVKDSKRLSRGRREKLYPKIIELCATYSFVCVAASEINEMMQIYSLNDIEAWAFSKAIKSLSRPPKEVFCDCCERHEWIFRHKIEAWMGGPNGAKIHSYHRADDRFPVTSAASVLAKVKRDEMILEISEELGEDIGSGYTGDAKTRIFLKTYYKENGEFPEHTRMEWKTVKKMQKKRDMFER